MTAFLSPGIWFRLFAIPILCPLGIPLTATTAVFLSISLAVSAAESQGEEVDVRSIQNSLVKVIESSESAIVAVARYSSAQRPAQNENPFDPFRNRFRNPNAPGINTGLQGATPNEFGTGIVISGPNPDFQRLILTNYHVIKGGSVIGRKDDQTSDRIVVQFSNRRSCVAHILAADPRSDLAVLTFDRQSLGLSFDRIQFLRLGKPQSPKKGQFVVLLGNPYAIARDGSASASIGIISNVSRYPAPAGPPDDPQTVLAETIHHYGTLLHVDTRLNLGTSGGALLNIDGDLVGVTTSLAALEGYESSAGYAIPVDEAFHRVIGSLVRGFEVEYGFLGIHPADTLPGELSNVPQQAGISRQTTAARVYGVAQNSPAAVGGLRQNDFILAVDGKLVYSRADLMREIGLLGPGAIANLRVWRESQRKEIALNVELGKWPVVDADASIATRRRFPVWRGIEVDYSTARLEYIETPFRSIPPAVVVTSYLVVSGQRPVDLQPGSFITHVNGIPVRSPAAFHEAVDRFDKEDVKLRLYDGRTIIVGK